MKTTRAHQILKSFILKCIIPPLFLIDQTKSSKAFATPIHMKTLVNESEAMPVDEDFIVFSTYNKFDWGALNYDAMVSHAAIRSGLKTYVFQGQAATRSAFLKYTKSPYLVGIFYDGDGNDALGYATGMMDANEDTITEHDIQAAGFNWKNVTFLSLTCHGFTNPLLDAIKKTNVRAYISGITTLHQHDENDTAVAQCGAEAMIRIIHGAPLETTFSFIQKCDAQDHSGDGIDEWGLYKTNTNDDFMVQPQMRFDVTFQFPSDFGLFIENGDDYTHKSGDKVTQSPHVLHMLFLNWKESGNRPMLLYDLYRHKVLNAYLWKNSENILYKNGVLTLPNDLEPN